MQTPKSWITDFVDLKRISDETFAREMTFAGNKVETVHKVDGETVYAFEITSNRPDTLSVIGLAREASAVFDRKLKLLKIPITPNLSKSPIRLTITDRKLCPVYSIVELDRVTVKPSSSLIQKRLTLSGIRPVNNVVDITNYLMLETGQPIHAFDADRIDGSLTLRAAEQGEQIIPLDHKERVLNGGEIIIEDQKKLVDLAGLMGGLNTEISETTTRALLLIPIYNPVAIRRASTFLRLRTEASTRFEKRLDLTQTETVARKAVALLQKETGGKQSTRILTREVSDTSMKVSDTLRLDPERVTKLVGAPFSEQDITRQLKKVGIEKTPRGYRIPSWRRDLERDVDLIEEVTRLYGFNNLPKTLPVGEIPIHPDALELNWRRRIADLVASLRYTETYGSTLVGKALIERLGFDSTNHLQVLRPMSVDFEYMRRSTTETLVPFLEKNLITQDSVQLFELGTVFHGTQEDELPYQPLELGLVATCDYARMKGDVEHLLHLFGVSASWQIEEAKSASFVHIVTILIEGTKVGTLERFHPQTVGADTEVWGATLNVSVLISKVQAAHRYPKQSAYPPIIEDVTLVRPQRGYLGIVITSLKESSPLVTNIEYIGAFNNAVTLRLTFQSYQRNLTQEEVNEVKASALEKVTALGWQWRSSPDSLQS